jgi:hypothetical protein
MSTQLKTTFFGVSNPEGRRLKDAFLEMSREYNLSVRVIEGGTQADLNRSSLNDDLVVFDASMEEGHNYAAATAQPMAIDRVLVVSRTYLPLNFYGLREGGAPEFPGRVTQSNQEILAWLRAQVAEFAGLPPRPDKHKGIIGYFRIIRESLKNRDAYWKERGRIFISYRSRHFSEVKKLQPRIERGDFHGGNRRSVFFLTPGELVYEDEILTEQRHWQLVSMIDRKIGVADELWIFETDDYYDSWWTRAELVTIAYRKASGTVAPKVRAYRPKDHTVHDLPADFLPALSVQERRRMARWYSNTDPGTMGPEALQPMRIYAQLPLIGRLRYFHDHVWSDEFWFTPILPCARCGARTQRPRLFDLDAFLWLRDAHLVRLSAQQLADAISRGEVACPACRTVYNITQAPHSRYLWMPVRAGRATGPDGSHLVELPIFRADQ